MEECFEPGNGGYDRVTQASMNAIYVKARELDRGQGGRPAPVAVPPGVAKGGAMPAAWDAVTRATEASDAETRPSDVPVFATDAETRASEK